MNKKIYFFSITILFFILLSNILVVNAYDDVFTINKTSSTIEEGKTRTFTITTKDEGEFYINVSDNSIINILYNGSTITEDDTIIISGTEEFTINALNSGSATITISTKKDNETYRQTIDVTVIEAPVRTLNIDNQDITITKGSTATFTITCDGEIDILIDTSDSNIATIICNGIEFDSSTITVSNEETLTINALATGVSTITIGWEYDELSAEDDGSWIENAAYKEITVTVVDNLVNINNTNTINDYTTNSISSINSDSSFSYTGLENNFMKIIIIITLTILISSAVP